ncbi:protein MAIN-LIKE 2-like [Mercurialis annua]|uniref:protein MAIN-LIKE 2-like n=1 Tax=Mercurialis annua TaxID=3986 RepID=UPI00215E174A|nr:protein MAIN-LIKE 2-like [Mercurialis annua]
MRQYQVDMTLVTALVERWRPETHTFMFSEGECTITLQDVAILTGLPTDGAPITGPTVTDWNSVTMRLLGRRYKPTRTDNGGFVKVSWLKTEFQKFEHVPAPGGQEQVDWAVRAYLLLVIWSLCFPDLNSGQIGLRILPTRLQTYSWGSATLAHLYHEMCLSILISERRKNIGGGAFGYSSSGHSSDLGR